MSYTWMSGIASLATRSVLPAAVSASGSAVEVWIDPDNKTIRVLLDATASAAVKASVRSAVIATPLGTSLHNQGWTCVADSARPRPYTCHDIRWALGSSAHKTLAGDVCVLSLRYSEIRALRKAVRLLRRHSASAQAVATFAMGGLPLLHWLTAPRSTSTADVTAAMASAHRYHLLPGLNWSGTPREKQVFSRWISDHLASIGGRVLIFDTGREGNGVRQAAALAREAITHAPALSESTVAILGIVDGPKRRSTSDIVRAANGALVELSVRYVRVPHLPTEDNGLLLGYEVDRRRSSIHPVDGLLLMRIERLPRIIDAVVEVCSRFEARLPWKPRSVPHVARIATRFARGAQLATTGGAQSLGAMVLALSRRELTWRANNEDRDWATAALLLAHAQRRERDALDSVVQAGLLAPAHLARVGADVLSRHELEEQRLLLVEWDRRNKRIVSLSA